MARRKYRIRLREREIDVELLEKSGSVISFAVNGVQYDCQIDPILEEFRESTAAPAPVFSSPRSEASPAKGAGEVVSPMHGIVVSIACEEGKTVAIGETLLVIDAMKMENNIIAQKAGTIARIAVNAGDEVERGQLLVSIE